jgi:CII-binding regulator of phage lambda lysogenization HflD
MAATELDIVPTSGEEKAFSISNDIGAGTGKVIIDSVAMKLNSSTTTEKMATNKVPFFDAKMDKLMAGLKLCEEGLKLCKAGKKQEEDLEKYTNEMITINANVKEALGKLDVFEEACNTIQNECDQQSKKFKEMYNE